MDPLTALIARRAASRLTESGHPRLPQQVEAMLAEGGVSGPQQHSSEPGAAVALASLVVSAASLACQLLGYSRRHRQSAASTPDALATRMSMILEWSAEIAAEDRTRIIRNVAEQAIHAGRAAAEPLADDGLDALPTRRHLNLVPNRRPTPGPDEGDDG